MVMIITGANPTIGSQSQKPAEDAELERLGEQIHKHIAKTHADARRRILQLVNLALHDGAGDGFRKEQGDEGGNGQCDQVRHRYGNT